MEYPEIDTHMFEDIFDEGAKAMQWRKNSLLNKWCWNNWISLCLKKEKKKKNIKPYLYSNAAINMKWVIDLNVQPNAVKLLDEKQEKIFVIWIRQRSLRYNNTKA